MDLELVGDLTLLDLE